VNLETMPEPGTPQMNPSILQRIWDWLTAPSARLIEIGEQRSARLAASFLFSIFTLLLFPIVIRAIRAGAQEALSGGLGIAFWATLVAYVLSRTKWYRLAIFIFSVAYSATAYISIIDQGEQADISLLVFVYVPVGLIVASAFLSWPTVFLLTGLNVGALVATRYFDIPVPDSLGAIAGITTVTGVVLILLTSFRDNTERARLEELKTVNRELESLSNELEQRVDARTQELVAANKEVTRRSEQLAAIAELTRSITDVQDLYNLLSNITRFISQRLGYYHVGIFINDANNVNAVLRAANSAGGQKMLSRGHKLKIGQEGIVGYAVKSGQPRIALDVGTDSVHFINPDLPESHSEMALPLRLGPEVVGALDIQSTETNAFSNEDMPVFTTLADQVSVAIQNARLLEQAQNALREVEEAYAEQAGRAWRSFSKKQAFSGFIFDGVEPKPFTSKSTSISDTVTGLTLPMRLRGQTIGKLRIKTNNADRKWTEEEISLAEAAIERAALALENARLLEEAQDRAAREQAIGEIANSLSRASDVENILQTTVAELGRRLSDTSRISIEMANINSDKVLDREGKSR